LAVPELAIFANNAQTVIAGPISAGALSVNLAAGTGSIFPTPAAGQYFTLTFQDQATKLIREIAWCTARSGDVCTIVRAQEGTTALPWLAGDTAANWWTAGDAAVMVQVAQLQQQPGNYAADSGTANSYAVTLTPQPASLAFLTGAPIRVKIANANTGVSTLTVNSLASTTIVNTNGNALSSGQIPAGHIVTFVFNGTNFELQDAPGVGGVLTGNLPNPGLASGVSASNIGALGGVLTGTLPNPGFAANPTFSGVLSVDISSGGGFGGSAIAINAQTDPNGAVIALLNNSGSKSIRTVNNQFQIINNAFSIALLILDDSGDFTVTGGVTGTTVQSSGGNIQANGGRLLASIGALNSGLSGAATLLSDFASSVAANGYQYLPSGMIFQWMSALIPGDSVPRSYALPVAFPNVCLWATGNYQALTPPPTGSIGVNPSGFTNSIIVTNSATSGSSGNNSSFIAIGR
jgi:hypothetical protein